MGEIKDISSGGELCRIALAIKVTAERENHSTMVFDEVDSGIGGAVSTAVGERLRKLGKNRQVLVCDSLSSSCIFRKKPFSS